MLKYACLLLWMALIFAVSHQPNNTLPDYGLLDFVVNKGAHVVAYFMLAMLARWATGSWRVALTVAILFAISDEIHQLFVAGRNGRFYDVAIDTVAALLAAKLTFKS